MEDIYKGRAKKEENEKLVNMLNEVFAPDSSPNFNFYRTLPKLYKPEYNPALNNMIVRHGSDIKAAVGIFYEDLTVAGTTLRCGGIGNVAVTSDSRGKGYMSDCMNLALKDMLQNNADLSFLGGQRQRYAYFSYEHGGFYYNYTISEKNILHAFNKETETDFEAVLVKPDDTALIEKMYDLYLTKTYRFSRAKNKFYDYLCSWRSLPYALFNKGEFKGYFIFTESHGFVLEFMLLDYSDIKDAFIALLKHAKDGTVNVPAAPFHCELLAFLSDVSELCSIESSTNMTVLNFRNTLYALLCNKAEIAPLIDTECTFLIDGYAKRENLHIKVKNNNITVDYTDKKADVELSHLSAIRLFFGISPIKIDNLPKSFAALLPIPFFIPGADNV
ncbi:MAG TPA: GNAT family N-acetyltransferase [Oscillospiraceae bacterium]|nr:GNAT family N-acetyltransferase [Oscillospiraceae bacterium]